MSYFLRELQSIKMKRILSQYTYIGKKLVSESACRISIVSYTTQAKSEDTKPVEWDSAKPYQSIPGPRALPLIGNKWRFLPLIGDFHGIDVLSLHRLFYNRYGKIVKLSGLALQDKVILYSPEDFEYLFRNEGKYPIRDALVQSIAYYRKHVRPEIFQGNCGVLEIHGEEWHNVRSKVNPIFMNPQAILQYVPNLDLIASQLVQKMRYFANSDPQREMPDDFLNCISAWTLESIMIVCLDKQLGCLELNLSKDSEPVRLIETIIEMFQLFFKIGRTTSTKHIYKTKMWKRYVELMDIITFTFVGYIEEAKERMQTSSYQHTKKNSILYQLLQVDERLVISTALDFLTAGADTTGRIAGSCMYYLAKTPNAQNTLREELLELLPNKDSPITKEVLSKASFLRAVIKETTRLSPTAIGNIRTTVKDMVISGYQIPKGTTVATSNLSQSLSEEYYPKAKEFIPERWLRSTTGNLSAKSTHPFVTMPFGFGPRSCLGKRFTLLELEVGIAKIIRNFYLEWHHKDATFEVNPVYGISDPLKLCIYEVDK